jgi:hypothetical protein
MRISLSQILVIGTGVVLFCGIIAVRMREDRGEQIVQAQPPPEGPTQAAVAAQKIAAPSAPLSSSPPPPPPEAASSAPNLPEVPVSLSLTPAPNGGGSRTDLENQSAESLIVRVTVSNRKVGHKYTTELTIPGYGTAQVEGVAAERGDQFTLASNGYKDNIIYFQ